MGLELPEGGPWSADETTGHRARSRWRRGHRRRLADQPRLLPIHGAPATSTIWRSPAATRPGGWATSSSRQDR